MFVIKTYKSHLVCSSAMDTETKMGTKKRVLTDPPTMPSSSRRRLYAEGHLPSAVAEWRDWASLPSDVLWVILSRLPHADVLRGARLACASWRRLAVDEPLLWRRIDLASGAPARWWQAMARAAVNRSAGRCESFRGPVDVQFLSYLAVADSAPSLRSLHVTGRLTMPNRDEELITGPIKKLTLLEQLVLSFRWVDEATLYALIDHPRLKLLDAGEAPQQHQHQEPPAATLA